MPLQKLSEAARGRAARTPGNEGQAAAPTKSGPDDDAPVKVYRWNEFGKEVTTEFDASHFQLEGHFESNSSSGHKEYQDRLRAIHFRKEGRSKADIARILGRSDKFVAKWWQKEEKEVPRPWGVHEYLSRELGQPTSNNNLGAEVSEDAKSAASWWRDVEIRRKYAQDPAIYQELLLSTDWQSGIARTRDFTTGASFVKYDKEGKTKLQGNQNARYKQGQSPALDRLMQKLFADYGIADRTSGIGLNLYPDGSSMLGSHRHDCWTALFSFGEERILTIDKTPILCQDGDLVIFGTQRHGVPLMPEITEGRITVPVFFYPDHLQMMKQWQTLTDPDDPRASRRLVRLENEFSLGSSAVDRVLWADPAHAAALEQLVQLGFPEEAARVALRDCGFNQELAAETLLMAGAGADLEELALALAAAESGRQELAAVPGGPLAARSGRWGASRAAAGRLALEAPGPTPCAASACEQGPGPGSRSSSCGGSTKVPPGAASGSSCCSSFECAPGAAAAASSASENGVEDADADRDAALALQLQLEAEEGGDWSGGAAAGHDDDDRAAALAAQLEEEERGAAMMSPELLEAQFAEYEDKLQRDDAENWHGHGDLMQSGLARRTLTLPTMDKATCYSIGHGHLPEKVFFELLSMHSVRTLYDFRRSDHRGDVHSPCQHFSVRVLRATCRTRGLKYKHVALGRESAYGVLAHIGSDEAQHALIELVWHAKRGRTAFLGFEEDWRQDHRQVIAEELVKAGHAVKHICSDGAAEDHEPGRTYPDFILREEERLRKLEKMQQAGELKRPEKSAVDRSTEAVAARLDRPPQEIDAMDEMRAANNQMELVQVQRKLARVQRLEEKHGLLANKVLTNTPQWILEEAREQQAWIAQKKAEKAQGAKAEAAAQKVQAASGAGDTPRASVLPEEGCLLVECASCQRSLPWADLQAGDGVCRDCQAQIATLGAALASDVATATSSSSSSAVPAMPAADPDAALLAVECRVCGGAAPWEVLRMADGVCPGCAQREEEARAAAATAPAVQAAAVQEPAAAGPGEAEGAQRPRLGWRAGRREMAAAAASAAVATAAA